MEIHIVKPGDTITSISEEFGVTVDKLLQDNGLVNTNNLVPGQAIVIVYPTQTYTVQEGDTLGGIAELYNTTLMQLLKNNSFLSTREYIYPGETLVISYETNRQMVTNGYAYPYIRRETLLKTLPYLTYLSIFNYQLTDEANIISYHDDSEIIQLAKYYGTSPLLMVSSISPKGEPNIELLYKILLSKEYHDNLVNNILNILKSTEYDGVNVMIGGINEINQSLYVSLINDISSTLNKEGYKFFVTINPNIKQIDNNISFEQIDYSLISPFVNGIIFLQYVWGTNTEPPAPVSSINLIRTFIDYVITLVPSDKILLGKPLIGYDWELPFVQDTSRAYSLTLDSAIILSRDTNSTIQFDEVSQTPYFSYMSSYPDYEIDHIVWFLDARGIGALYNLINDYSLLGSGMWNIMVYYQQMWTIINSQFELIKLLPDKLS
ncbi:MAG: LysM peptidoglycan-binding domain-containing protein [Mobilitalea sp.]